MPELLFRACFLFVRTAYAVGVGFRCLHQIPAGTGGAERNQRSVTPMQVQCRASAKGVGLALLLL